VISIYVSELHNYGTLHSSASVAPLVA
jgi:hypothetical protein